MTKNWIVRDGSLRDAGEGGGTILVLIDPDEAEKRRCIEELSIDAHTLSSALDPDELGRLELEPEHAALIIKRPRNYSSENQYSFSVSSMGLFLFRDRLVIVAREELAPLDGHQFQKVGSLTDLLLRIIFRTTLHYLEHLKIMNSIADALEQKINRAMENKYLINLFSLEKGMVYYLNALHSNGVVIEKLRVNAAKIGLSPADGEYLEDLVIENSQCEKLAEIYSNVFASLMDARVSVVNNNLNVLMKTLNIITISIMVPTLVVSVFSMNVRIPIETMPYAFWIILGLSSLASGVVAVLWKIRNSRR